MLLLWPFYGTSYTRPASSRTSFRLSTPPRPSLEVYLLSLFIPPVYPSSSSHSPQHPFLTWDPFPSNGHTKFQSSIQRSHLGTSRKPPRNSPTCSAHASPPVSPLILFMSLLIIHQPIIEYWQWLPSVIRRLKPSLYSQTLTVSTVPLFAHDPTSWHPHRCYSASFRSPRLTPSLIVRQHWLTASHDCLKGCIAHGWFCWYDCPAFPLLWP